MKRILVWCIIVILRIIGGIASIIILGAVIGWAAVGMNIVFGLSDQINQRDFDMLKDATIMALALSPIFAICFYLLEYAPSNPRFQRMFGGKGYDLDLSYPPDWEQIRQKVLARDHFQCGNCGSTRNLHVHHIVPLSVGGSNALSNLRTLCKTCHAKLHPHMRS